MLTRDAGEGSVRIVFDVHIGVMDKRETNWDSNF